MKKKRIRKDRRREPPRTSVFLEPEQLRLLPPEIVEATGYTLVAVEHHLETARLRPKDPQH